MKSVVGITFVALVHCASAATSLKSVGVSFGPKNCVRLTRSHAGSCVISTNCEGVDTSNTEFAFDCIGQNGKGDVVRHSFGVGGFEAAEEFDSEVKCGRCATVSHENEFPIKAPVVRKVEAVLKPVAQPVQKAAAAVAQAVPAPKPEPKHEEVVPGAVSLKSKTNAAAWPFSSGEKPKGDSKAVKYGPNGCVSTWRSAEGHCIMQTKCNKDDMESYEFGLVCVNKGSPVKHLFGKDSFDPKETFDTLIKCEKCLGLEDIPDTVAIAGEVASMAKDVKNIEEVMKNISINVNMLNKAVFPSAGPAPGPASAAPAPAAAAKPAKFLVHEAKSHHRHHHRGNLRHSQKRHHRHHRREEDDDDRDDDDDNDDEEYDRRDDRDDREDDHEEEPPRPAVDDLNAAAVKLQQQQAAQAAAEAQYHNVPMNAASTNVNVQVPVKQLPAAEEDDDDESDDGFD